MPKEYHDITPECVSNRGLHGCCQEISRRLANFLNVAGMVDGQDTVRVWFEVIPKVKEAPYGYCPVCGAPGVARERRLNGDDRCQSGHTYPSNTAKTALQG